MIVYTSGTTGPTQGGDAELPRAGLGCPRDPGRGPERERRARSPTSPAWIVGRTLVSSTALLCGYAVSFPEEPETALPRPPGDRPHHHAGGAKGLGGHAHRVEVEIEDSTRLKRWLYHRLLPIGQQTADLRQTGQAPSIRPRLAHVLAERLILRPVRDRLGLLRPAASTRRSAARAGGVPLVPRHRRAAQAARSDRSQRHLRRASRR